MFSWQQRRRIKRLGKKLQFSDKQWQQIFNKENVGYQNCNFASKSL